MSPNVLELLRHGHRTMGNVLSLIRMQTEMLQGPDDLQGIMLLNNAIEYMQWYPSVAHHPAEEVLYSKMIKTNPNAQALCIDLEDQHQWFRDCHTALLRLIRETQAGDMSACESLVQQLQAYCTRHFDHVSLEEARAYPLANDLLTNSDWEAALVSYEIHADPLFDADLLQRYDSIYDYLMESRLKPIRH